MSNSKYNFVTWLVAIILAIYLFWQWQQNHGMGACCGAPVAATHTPLPAPLAPAPIAEAFKCTATADKFESSGDSSAIAWLSKSAELSNWLKTGGADWQVSCSDAMVTLSGSVDNEATKIKAGADALAFFGDKVAIDNQLTVKVVEKALVPAAITPPTVSLYFDTGKTQPSSEAEALLNPIAEWLKTNPNAKAVISGYHDPRGNKTANANLAKNRAKAASTVLMQLGVDQARIELRKPANSEGNGDLNQARRVEVSVE